MHKENSEICMEKKMGNDLVLQDPKSAKILWGLLKNKLCQDCQNGGITFGKKKLKDKQNFVAYANIYFTVKGERIKNIHATILVSTGDKKFDAICLEYQMYCSAETIEKVVKRLGHEVIFVALSLIERGDEKVIEELVSLKNTEHYWALYRLLKLRKYPKREFTLTPIMNSHNIFLDKICRAELVFLEAQNGPHKS